MKKSFINETGELVMEPPTPKTLVDVFSEVELIIEEKLDTAVNAFQQQESLPKGMNIAGIDLTDNGKILTFEEQEKIEAHVSKLYKQRQKMRHLLAGVDAILMPQTVFKDLAKKLGLFMLYPTETGEMIYTIPTDRARSINIFNRDKKNMMKIYIFSLLVGFVIFAISLPFYDVLSKEPFHAFCFLYLCLVISIPFVAYYYINNSPEKLDNIFTNNILKNTNTPQRGKDSIIHIKLPKVPDNIRRVMIDVWNKVGSKKGFQICTLADNKAINYEIKLGTSANPPQLESNDYDPGLFVDYGEYVAIIPATFYNITDMEQQFIDKALEVGEKWDACAYIYN